MERGILTFTVLFSPKLHEQRPQNVFWHLLIKLKSKPKMGTLKNKSHHASLLKVSHPVLQKSWWLFGLYLSTDKTIQISTKRTSFILRVRQVQFQDKKWQIKFVKYLIEQFPSRLLTRTVTRLLKSICIFRSENLSLFFFTKRIPGSLKGNIIEDFGAEIRCSHSKHSSRNMVI